jgi:hypothetical protein
MFPPFQEEYILVYTQNSRDPVEEYHSDDEDYAEINYLYPNLSTNNQIVGKYLVSLSTISII